MRILFPVDHDAFERRASQRCCNTTPYHHSIPLDGHHENEPAWGVQHHSPRGESFRVGGPVGRECPVVSHAMVLRVCQKLPSIAYLAKAKLVRIAAQNRLCDIPRCAVIGETLPSFSRSYALQKIWCTASSPAGVKRAYIGLLGCLQQISSSSTQASNVLLTSTSSHRVTPSQDGKI